MEKIITAIINLIGEIIPLVRKPTILKYCLETNNRYVFDSKLLIKSPKRFYKSMYDTVVKAGDNKNIVYDFSKVEKYNDSAREIIRDAIRDLLNIETIQLTVIFPDEVLSKLFLELKSSVKEKNKEHIVRVIRKLEVEYPAHVKIEMENADLVLSIVLDHTMELNILSRIDNCICKCIEYLDVVILDITQLTFIDSMFIGILFKYAKSKKIILQIADSNEVVKSTLTTIGLSSLIQIDIVGGSK
jgi:anti-anti-sigma regulatory factor